MPSRVVRRVPKYTPIKPGGRVRDPARSCDLSQCPTCALFTPLHKKNKKQHSRNHLLSQRSAEQKGPVAKRALAKGLRPTGLPRLMTPCIWMSVTVIRVIDKGDKQ